MGEEAATAGEPPLVGSRLGSFELIAPAGRWGSQARFVARGTAAGAFAGTAALVVAAPIAGESEARVNASVARLRAIAALRHDALLPVVEAGAWEGGLYFAQVPPGDLTLTARLEGRGPIRPAETASCLSRLAAALDAARDAQVPHGDVRAANVWFGTDGRPMLGGFALTASDDQSAAADTAALATLVASMLTGQHGVAGGSDNPAPAPWDGSWGLPDAVRESVQRGFDPDPARRYPSAGSLAAAFVAAIDTAVANQIAGVWEAMERRDFAMAEMLCDAACALRPGNGELDLLRLHVRTNSGQTSATFPMLDGARAGQLAMPRAALTPAVAHRPDSSARSDVTAQGDLDPWPPELTTLLTAPSGQEGAPANAWVALATGMVVLTALMFLAALLAMSYR